MPINIYEDKTFKSIAKLSDDNWELPDQIDALEKWLFSIGKNLPKGKYVADVGFDIRKDASGGGAVINSKMIKMLAEIGMEIYLSEYPEAD
ncbi:hypothetical protein [Flavobacterium sangjuense]|uniref:Uncharacterized protein n=1 Tax=Flavobacterium sangjuense TaxID=2518177 RepID=A0A4P7PT65_9FLAO|nr:hypothetical protein [Flavobacterium sangjuense]QBZ97440.1 hypothetical protein GS03_00930 [Flavobacterium sangjuense]